MDPVSFEIRNTRTGDLELPVSVASASWRAQIDPGSNINVSIRALDGKRQIPRSLLHALTEPTGEFSVLVREGPYALAAGPILDADADHDASEIRLQCSDLNTFWNRRMGASVRYVTLGDLNIVDRSASGFVRAVLWRAMDELNPDFPRWHLPVDLPDDGSGSWSLETDWWEFKMMGELLDMVRGRGYSIHHKPYLTSDNKLRYTTDVAKVIVGPAVPLILGAPKSPLSQVRYRRNGEDLASGVLRIGNGEGEDTLTRFAAADEIGAPIRHIVNTDAKSVKSGTWLQAAADADIEENGPPQTGWSLKVTKTEEFPLAAYAPGRAIHLDVRNHWLIPAGVHKLRVVALSGDEVGRTATPEVIPYA